MSNKPSGQSPVQWIEEGEKHHADCRVFQIQRRRFRHPERSAGTDFYVVDSPDWAMAIAETADGKWLLVRQFRFGLRELTWEFPSGCIEPGEEPAAAARRELEEETGYIADDPILLGVVRPNPAIMNNACHIYYFPNAHPSGATNWDEHEEIEVKAALPSEVAHWATDGTIVHSLVHTSLFLHRAWSEREASSSAGESPEGPHS